MRRFAELFTRLDETNKTSEKVAALVDYFRKTPPADGAWAVFFLSGRRPRLAVPTPKLHAWAAEAAELPFWIFEESYQSLGDLAETIALVFPEQGDGNGHSLTYWVEERLLRLADVPEEDRKRELAAIWKALDRTERFVFTKLMTGAWRVGVSQRLLTRALSQAGGVEPSTIAHRLMGHWQPDGQFFRHLFGQEEFDLPSRPYPFHLAYPLDGDPAELGDVSQWAVEWKWDGIRAQLIRRQGETYLWSRGEELITDRFPEVADSAATLPDGTVLDGEILAWKQGRVLPFSFLQRRTGRKKLTRTILKEAPAIFLGFDVLEWEGRDIRSTPYATRRQKLQIILQERGEPLLLSPLTRKGSWKELEGLRQESRDRNVEGFVLKHQQSRYAVGRKKGDWWKWKVDPYSVDAVLIYAQRGSGRRASLYTDYTFGIWLDTELVPFAKAYSGLSDAEIRDVDRFVRQNTLDRFGPVRHVSPELVMEIGFDGINPSNRHKSGVAVRFPRILRWRRDKKPRDADTLETVRLLLPKEEST